VIDFACPSVRVSDTDVNHHLNGVAKCGEYATAPNLHYPRATVSYASRWDGQMLDSSSTLNATLHNKEIIPWRCYATEILGLCSQ